MSKFSGKVTAALLAVTVATGCSTIAARQAAKADDSYDQAEKNRANTVLVRADDSYDQAEKNRANGIATGSSGLQLWVGPRMPHSNPWVGARMPHSNPTGPSRD